MPDQGPSEIVIEAGGARREFWRDLWRYRELFWFLSWRDLVVRYKQTAIGVAWSVLRPLLTLLVFSVVFGRLGHFPSHGVPYPLLVGAALLPWQLFAGALSESSGSLVANAALISKVYFPRIIVPASSMLVSLTDFAVSLCILVGLLAWYGVAPSWRMLALPGLVGLAVLAALGAGLWLAALNVRYRDFRYIVPFLVQLGLYVSPVGFSSAVVPERWRLLYAANPMVGVIDGFRWAVLGGAVEPSWTGVAVSAGVAVFVLVLGLRYFRAAERGFADVI